MVEPDPAAGLAGDAKPARRQNRENQKGWKSLWIKEKQRVENPGSESPHQL
jgi:hypothetical protein